MTTINDLLISTARDLNDYTDHIPNKQFQRWTREQLLGYWNEAMCVMFALSPSKFKASKVVKLKPGINQVFDDCKRVLSVIGVSDENGNVLYEIEPETTDRKLKWGGFRPRNCTIFKHTKDFKLTSYRIMSDKDGSVFVKPEVPYGVDVWLKFMCEQAPQPFDMMDLQADVQQTHCSDVAFGIHWVLFRALMIDEESQSSTQLATSHLQTFFKLLEVRIESDKEASYNLDNVPKILQQVIARELAKFHIGAKS